MWMVGMQSRATVDAILSGAGSIGYKVVGDKILGTYIFRYSAFFNTKCKRLS